MNSTYFTKSYSVGQILNIVQCGLGGLIIVINIIFLTILALGRWRLHRPKRYAVSANLSLADLISGLVLVALAMIVLLDLYGGTMMYMLLETCMSANFAMCALCYLAIFRIQYVATKRPVMHFLYLTTARLFAIVTLIWMIAHAYAFGKGYAIFFLSTKFIYYMAITELAIMGGMWLLNFVVFFYVLHQAYEKVYANKDQNSDQEKQLLKANGKPEEGEPEFSCDPIAEYAFLKSMGLNLFIFFLSFGPLWVHWVMSLYWHQEVYFEQRTMVTRHLLLLVCFLRAIFEPFVHLLRQPKLMCGDQYVDCRD